MEVAKSVFFGQKDASRRCRNTYDPPNQRDQLNDRS